MTFLQPWLLMTLPLVALPVIIHLINQRRFQSVEWAAMRFLLAAKAISPGANRLRQWLIMLLRMLAVAAVILAISRPLSRGWLAAAGGDPSATAIVLLDRSPSMSQASETGGASKLTTARRQLAAALETLGATRVVLIDSVSCEPRELDSPRAIEEIPEAGPADAAADLPVLLQAACEQFGETKSAAGVIWICSDQRANDWKVSDAAWPAIRETLSRMPQSVRLTLLAYPEPAADNLAVRVTRAVLEPRGKTRELLLDIAVMRESDTGPTRVPVQIELGAARSTVEVELTGLEAVLAGHAIPIDADALAGGMGGDHASAEADGWGRVSIPADSNPADDAFYFVFGTPLVRRTLIVSDADQEGAEADRQTARTLELVAGIPPDRASRASVETVAPAAIPAMPLDDVALLLWHARLPENTAADVVDRFVARGGRVIFLPPGKSPSRSPSSPAFGGMAWTSWEEHSPAVRPTSWRADEGLLAATLAGAALPVGDLEIRRSCGVAGEGTPLAVLPDGRPLVTRAASGGGGIFFLATTPAMADSDLGAKGVVLYALVQRAIDAGLASVGSTRQVDAGETVPGTLRGMATAARREDRGGRGNPIQAARNQWRQIAGPSAPSTETGFHAGAYASEGRLLVVNRPAAEDTAAVLEDRQVDALFQGLSFTRFRQRAGGAGGIVQEVWRLFLIAVLLALAAEGLLCLPRIMPDARRGVEAVA